MNEGEAKKSFVLDTNVLLHDPRALFSFDDNDVVIPQISCAYGGVVDADDGFLGFTRMRVTKPTWLVCSSKEHSSTGMS